MPELPDTERYWRNLSASALHSPATRGQPAGPSLWSGASARNLGQELQHQSLEPAIRRGKYPFVASNGNTWLG
ncbi:MAG: hypothetical protein PVJ39_05700 [Gammaproteobacteria bacterium]